MFKRKNHSNNQEKNMKQTINKYLRGASALALCGGMIFMTSAALQAKAAGHIKVHVEVNVHGSDVGVSSDVLEETVDKLLEEAEIDVDKNGGSSETELKIDIYKDEAHGFKADANWDDDGDPEVEKFCAEQDEIDSIVEEEVHAFIAFIHHK